MNWYYSCRSFKLREIDEDPRLKAASIWPSFRGLKPSAPSEIVKTPCSLRSSYLHLRSSYLHLRSIYLHLRSSYLQLLY
jgi:hypothetical protein